MVHPQFDPVAFWLFGWPVRWYGLTYLAGFACAWGLANWRLHKMKNAILPARDGVAAERLLFAGVVGVFVGGRLGYVVFYDLAAHLENPQNILKIWRGGMSFHGGLIGVVAGVLLSAWRQKIPALTALDFVAPLAPLGLLFGRIGNFINGELWGRASDAPWAMVFPQSGDDTPRHPSQIYEAAGEGALLFAVLWWYSLRPRPAGAVGGLFLCGYAIARFTAEFFREPDAHIGLQWLQATRGQWLCVPMMLAGAALLWRANNRRRG